MKDTSLKIMIDDTKPNLKKLRAENKEQFLYIVKTFMELAEEMADSSRDIPWYELPKMLNEKMTLKMVLEGLIRAAFNVEAINPDTYPILKHTLHPLSLFGQNTIPIDGVYTSWQKYFLLDPDQEINSQAIENTIRKLMYYARYINVEKFGKALLSNRMEVYKALGQENLEKLPFVPALRYQQQHFSDLHVGKFLDEIGAFDCGSLDEMDIFGDQTCPSCHHRADMHGGWVEKLGKYAVCKHCNAGFKITRGAYGGTSGNEAE